MICSYCGRPVETLHGIAIVHQFGGAECPGSTERPLLDPGDRVRIARRNQPAAVAGWVRAKAVRMKAEGFTLLRISRETGLSQRQILDAVKERRKCGQAGYAE
jgi:hypothetical protein